MNTTLLSTMGSKYNIYETCYFQEEIQPWQTKKGNVLQVKNFYTLLQKKSGDL